MEENNKIVVATRATIDSFDDCIEKLKSFNIDIISKSYIICNRRGGIRNDNIEVIFDSDPVRPTAFNLIIDRLKKEQKEDERYNLDFYFERYGEEKTKEKIKFMYKRLSKETRKLVESINFKNKKINNLFKEGINKANSEF